MATPSFKCGIFSHQNCHFFPNFTVKVAFQKSVWNERRIFEMPFLGNFSKFLFLCRLPSPVSELWETLRSKISGIDSTNFKRCIEQGKGSICSIFFGYVQKSAWNRGNAQYAQYVQSWGETWEGDWTWTISPHAPPKLNWTHWAFPLF